MVEILPILFKQNYLVTMAIIGESLFVSVSVCFIYNIANKFKVILYKPLQEAHPQN